MITRPTTLILGAGASAPFGFPTGYELLNKIIEMSITPVTDTDAKLPFFANFSKAEIGKFREALRRSGKTSVDAFLEHRPEFIPIGKAAMAIALIAHEHEPLLFKHDGKNWYEYLFNQLNAQFEEFDKNQLSILTFNYDRSLEHFLFTALKNSSGKSDDECAEKIKSIPIIHFHGDLGALPYTGEVLARPYNTELLFETVAIASERIKIIHEGITNDLRFSGAHRFLSESEVICFLGFGYHPLNMERLGFNGADPHSLFPKSKIVHWSSFGLTNAEANQVSGRYRLPFRLHRLEYQKLDVLQFLREVGVLHNN